MSRHGAGSGRTRTRLAPPNDKRKVMVTGAGGALGRRVIERLKERYDVVGVDFRWRKHVDPDVVHYEVDFEKRKFQDVFREHRFAGVIHLGRIGSAQLNRARRYNSNVIGTERLLQYAQQYGVRKVVILSSHYVYGADANNPALLDESTPMKAANLTNELVDSVELENLCNIYLYKHPELNITILRSCNIVGPGVQNNISKILSSRVAPCLMGFSPMMQFIHVDDLAEAVVLAYEKDQRGVYNVAPDDWIAYQDALELAGCHRLFLPSLPPVLPRALASLVNGIAGLPFPSYLVNYFKYPVIIDGRLFAERFGFKPRRTLREIFEYYRGEKSRKVA
jgi:UDP-glucose 4-epimerase